MSRDVVRVAVRIVRAAVAVGLVVWLVGRSGVADVSADDVRWPWIAAGLLVVPISLALRALSLGLLLNRDRRILTASQLYRLTLIGAALGLLLPVGASDLAKARYGLVEHGYPEEMVVSSIVDKLTSLTAVAFMGGVAALATGDGVLAVVAAAVAVAGILPFVTRWPAPWRLLVRLLAPGRAIDPERVARHARPPLPLLLGVLGVSLAGWVVTFSIVYAAARGVGADVTVFTVLAVAPLATMARLAPVSAGGLGLGEVTIAALLVRAGVPRQVAAQAALLQMVLAVLVPGLVGLLVYAVKPSRGPAGSRT